MPGRGARSASDVVVDEAARLEVVGPPARLRVAGEKVTPHPLTPDHPSERPTPPPVRHPAAFPLPRIPPHSS